MPLRIHSLNRGALIILFSVSLAAPALAEDDYSYTQGNTGDTASYVPDGNDSNNSSDNNSNNNVSDSSGNASNADNTANASSSPASNAVPLTAQSAAAQANSPTLDAHKHYYRKELHEQHGWQGQAFNGQTPPNHRFDNRGFRHNERAQTIVASNREYARPEPRRMMPRR